MTTSDLLTNSQLQDICAKYFVRELYAFGSAVREEWKEGSDLDFVVTFQPGMDPLSMGKAFLDLHYALESLFDCPVDLVSYRTLKNPAFKANVDATKVSVYAA